MIQLLRILTALLCS